MYDTPLNAHNHHTQGWWHSLKFTACIIVLLITLHRCSLFKAQRQNVYILIFKLATLWSTSSFVWMTILRKLNKRIYCVVSESNNKTLSRVQSEITFKSLLKVWTSNLDFSTNVFQQLGRSVKSLPNLLTALSLYTVPSLYPLSLGSELSTVATGQGEGALEEALP